MQNYGHFYLIILFFLLILLYFSLLFQLLFKEFITNRGIVYKNFTFEIHYIQQLRILYI